MSERQRQISMFRTGMKDYLSFHEYESIRNFALIKGLDVQRMTLYLKRGNVVAPGLDFLTQLKESCPDLDMNWLLTGVGEMIIKSKK